jgi:hypothetical protein
VKRFTLTDNINLRTSAAYKSPAAITPLQIVYGDFSQGRIKCNPIDANGLFYHVSDRPMQTIETVYSAGAPLLAGFTPYTAYQDETGNSISCIMFDSPHAGDDISISGKGAMKDTGELIENPADLVRDVMLNVQGYDPGSIDLAEMSRFYSDCLKQELIVACVLQEIAPLRTFLDELARNIHASWMLSDGKSVMRLRWI